MIGMKAVIENAVFVSDRISETKADAAGRKEKVKYANFTFYGSNVSVKVPLDLNYKQYTLGTLELDINPQNIIKEGFRPEDRDTVQCLFRSAGFISFKPLTK